MSTVVTLGFGSGGSPSLVIGLGFSSASVTPSVASIVSGLADSPADITQAALIALAVASHPDADDDWPVYATGEPDSPDNCITVYNTLGRDIGRSMVDGSLNTYYGIQVRIRAKDDPTGWDKADSIRKSMACNISRTQVTVDSVHSYLIHCFCSIGGVLSLGNDTPKTKRRLFTVNALIDVRQL